MHFDANPKQKAGIAHELISLFLETSIVVIAPCNSYRPELAVNEVAEDFLRRNIPIAKCLCNQKEVFFTNEILLTSEQKRLAQAAGKPTKIPLVSTIELGIAPIRGNLHPLVLSTEIIEHEKYN